MLQRLPSLGRVGTESNDRQFVDIYILDGLRAKDISNICQLGEEETAPILASKWANPLDDLGQRILAGDTQSSEKARHNLAVKATKSGNFVLASDIVAAHVRENKSTPNIDFENIAVNNGEFLLLSLDERNISNLKIENSYIGQLMLPAKNCNNVIINECISQRVSGISSPAALPSWISKLHSDEFDSVASVSRIRKIGLKPSHEILTTIIRKTFFQKGKGRKEEALLRGLGKIGAKSLSDRILNIMIRENLLTSFKGDEGNVYSPVRSHTKRMQKILDELESSEDPLWVEVGKL